MKTAFILQMSALGIRRFAPLLPALLLPVPSLAQVAYGGPYSDPYKSGPTRPLDGSPRSGVYSARPAPIFEPAPRPAYEAAPRSVGAVRTDAELPMIWRGFYGGVLLGRGWNATEIAIAGAPSTLTRGTQIGALAGYNFQSGSFVYGLEGDVMAGSASASATGGGVTLAARDTWTASLRARAGYVFGPALLYGTGGLALGARDVSVTSGVMTSSFSDTRIGWVLGAGLELQLTEAFTARIEGLHTSYKDSALGFGTLKQDANVLRAGVSYRFN